MKLIINNKTIEVNRELTVLEAAEENGIYIPKMCAHPELVPYGGCRLCIVEIEGRKGYPTSCTTIVEDGMIVRTDTNTLQEMRIDLVQLILSEHPSACLLCEDIVGCSQFQETIRKVGVTTGCRWCPKDKDCELQKVVESFNITELTLPGLYRDHPVEKYDPFFDRDYNLCIYCGRCVRICNEYRKSSVLSLRQRGKHTTIGPSFDTNHTDAGCEYCGACVSVCPTGAMSEKSRKWWGMPDTYSSSICPLCSINCEIQVLSLHDKIVGTIPPGKPHESAGELCVKGRFCLSEIVNRTERILEPQFHYPEGYGIVSWDEVITKGGEILQNLKPERSAVFISPDLPVEDYLAAKTFSEKVLKTDVITSSCFDTNMIAYTKLALNSVSLEKVRKADNILSLFLNGNYNFAPLTMAVKGAASSGIPYYQLGWIKDTTSRFATHSIVPEPGDEVRILDRIITCIESGKCDNEMIKELSDRLKENDNPVIIIGPWVLSLSNCTIILDRIRKIISITNSKLYMPDPHGNLRGLLSSVSLKPVESVLEKINK
ncbi:MAG: (2Fe-2S)-binding protein, partial [Bacteroidales bacterium]|nr:(2Fe-2S)-binding protein [Bacteroidales bacterium]